MSGWIDGWIKSYHEKLCLVNETACLEMLWKV